jgi:hypothetical protein
MTAAVLRRLVGAVALLFAAVGTACCVAGVIGIWLSLQAVAERVRGAAERVDDGLQRVTVAGQTIQGALAKARADMAAITGESADLRGGGEKGRRASRAVRSLVQQQAGPNLDELGGRLATMSDAAVAVSSLLESFREVAPGRVSRLEPERLQTVADSSRRLSATLRRLEVEVGDGAKDADGRAVAATANEVDLLLQRCQAAMADWQSGLGEVRADVARARDQSPGWLTTAAVAVTVLCVWVGAGQVCLFGRGLMTWRDA